MENSKAETVLRFDTFSPTCKKSRPSIVAIITARGGSKGVPRKNVRLVAGKPLITYSIEAANQCELIDKCYVTTEDAEIKQVSRNAGADIIDRPNELAADMTLSSDVVIHALQVLQSQDKMPDYFILLQPTSPLRNAGHIKECVEQFLKSTGYLSCISVIENEHHPYKSFLVKDNTLQPLTNYEDLNKPRQALPTVYRQNGAMYLMKSDVFLKYKSFCVQPIMPFVMNSLASIDIDTEDDLKYVEFVMNNSGIF